MSGVADSIEIGSGSWRAALTSRSCRWLVRDCEHGSASDTGAGEAVGTALDRFLAAGIS
jgi:hypothetical protein